MITCRGFTAGEIDLLTPIAVRNGLEPYTDRLRHWWNENPFRDAFADAPAGWVLETDEGSQVGVGLNLPMLFELDGGPVKVAIHSSAAVDPAFRSKSLLLFMRFLKQKQMDVCIVGSTSGTTTKIYTAAAKRIPSPGSDVPILWPIDYGAFAHAVLQRKQIRAGTLLAGPAGAALRVFDVLRAKRASPDYQIKRITGFDDRFDAFWEQLRQSSPSRLRAIRSRAALEWRFKTELREGTATILTAEGAGKLAGYAVLVRQVRSEFKSSLSEFTDLQAIDDSPEVLRALIAGAIRASREDGVAILKLRAWNAQKREIALSLNAWSYQYPLWQSYYNCLTPSLSDALARPETWDFSPFEIF